MIVLVVRWAFGHSALPLLMEGKYILSSLCILEISCYLCILCMLTYTITSFRDDIDKGKTFIGNTGFFLSKDVDLEFWFFQFAFACAVSSIVAGTIAERCKMTAYLFYSLVSIIVIVLKYVCYSLILYCISYIIYLHIHTTVLIRLCLPCSSPLILECQWIPLCFCC